MRTIGTSAAASVIRTNEPDHFAAVLQGGRFDYMQRQGRPFRAAIRLLRLGDVTAQAVEIGGCVNQGAIAPDVVGLVLPVALGAAPTLVNGRTVGDGETLLLPGGAEFVTSAEDQRAWVSLALPRRFVAGLADLAPPPAILGGSAAMLRLAAGPVAELRDLLLAAAAMAEKTPDEFAAEGRAEGLAAALRELAVESLTAATLPSQPRRATREAARVFRQAEEALRAGLARPIRRDELCVTLGVSRRKLHDAFMATVGMSPAAYLKLRRLALARRALRAGRGHAPLVKAVALSHGFWHLGYFARDYRALFGETPSQTVAAGRPGWAPELA